MGLDGNHRDPTQPTTTNGYRPRLVAELAKLPRIQLSTTANWQDRYELLRIIREGIRAAELARTCKDATNRIVFHITAIRHANRAERLDKFIRRSRMQSVGRWHLDELTDAIKHLD